MDDDDGRALVGADLGAERIGPTILCAKSLFPKSAPRAVSQSALYSATLRLRTRE